MIVWRSHYDKRKKIEYNDSLGVLIVSSNSQAHNDDYGPTIETAIIVSKWEMMGHQQNLFCWAATLNGPSPATGRLDYLGNLPLSTFQGFEGFQGLELVEAPKAHKSRLCHFDTKHGPPRTHRLSR